MKFNEIPVLLIIFNRPGHFERLLDQLKLIKPKKIYIAGDGPRNGHASDVHSVNETRQKLKLINWTCEIKTLFQKKKPRMSKSCKFRN